MGSPISLRRSSTWNKATPGRRWSWEWGESSPVVRPSSHCTRRRRPSDPWSLGVCDFAKVSGGLQPRLPDVVTYRLVDDVERVAEGGRRRWAVSSEQRNQQPVVDPGVEQREADPVAGEDVGVAAGQATGEALAA